jgi:hypothetical protein
MGRKLANLVVALGLGVAVVGGTLTSCDDDDDNNAVTGVGGTGGTSTGGIGGGTVTNFNMTLTGGQVVPPNTSPGTGNVQVMLNQSTGALLVTGSFTGLTSNATVAHIHGPTGVGQVTPPLITLDVPALTAGTVTGTGTMNNFQMSDMLSGSTYVDIHSDAYPDGEIRAQIVP